MEIGTAKVKINFLIFLYLQILQYNPADDFAYMTSLIGKNEKNLFW